MATKVEDIADRRKQVRDMYEAGASKRDIALKLGVSVGTVMNDLKASEPESNGPTDVSEEHTPHIAHAPDNGRVGDDVCSIARVIWPAVLERVAKRLRRNDERFRTAAEDTVEAAQVFRIKAARCDSEQLRLALAIWPAIWRDYNARGLMKNIQLASESAEMAIEASRHLSESLKDVS